MTCAYPLGRVTLQKGSVWDGRINVHLVRATVASAGMTFSYLAALRQYQIMHRSATQRATARMVIVLSDTSKQGAERDSAHLSVERYGPPVEELPDNAAVRVAHAEAVGRLRKRTGVAGSWMQAATASRSVTESMHRRGSHAWLRYKYPR